MREREFAGERGREREGRAIERERDKERERRKEREREEKSSRNGNHFRRERETFAEEDRKRRKKKKRGEKAREGEREGREENFPPPGSLATEAISIVRREKEREKRGGEREAFHPASPHDGIFIARERARGRERK